MKYWIFIGIECQSNIKTPIIIEIKTISYIILLKI